MFNPHFDRVIKMCETLANKHVGEMNMLDLRWNVLELYDERNGILIQQPTPWLVIDFK